MSTKTPKEHIGFIIDIQAITHMTGRDHDIKCEAILVPHAVQKYVLYEYHTSL